MEYPFSSPPHFSPQQGAIEDASASLRFRSLRRGRGSNEGFRRLLLMEESLHQLRLVVYPVFYKVLYIPGGAGLLPSTV